MVSTQTFQSFRVHEAKKAGHLQDIYLHDLTQGDTVIRSYFSSLNYKDALAVTGKGKILKRFPLNPGIDVVGEVIQSSDPQLHSGTFVVITGCQLGESYDGGLSEIVRVPSSIAIPLPQGLSPRNAMIYGTAGFTAALAILRMEINGQKPSDGPILITGSSGGVGSFAVAFLHQRGYEVHALSGKPSQHQRLKDLGANQVMLPEDLHLGHRPLEKGLWAGVVDSVGGELLSKLIPHIKLWGQVASIGLAGGASFSGTVMPHILRGVSILGISSNNCPWDMRLKIWNDLASFGKVKNLDSFVSQNIHLEGVLRACEQMLHRKTFGRILVEIPRPTSGFSLRL